MSLMSLGLVRGLIGQFLGTAAGMLLVTIIRLVFGLSPTWKQEPAWVAGAILGAIGFMIGVGALTDWYQWVLGKDTPMHHGPPEGKPAWVTLLRCRL